LDGPLKALDTQARGNPCAPVPYVCDRDIERVQTFAKELVGLRPDVLIGRSTPTTIALKRETGTIPIIFVNVPEPVEQGFVQSLARPGGNITGFTNFEASIGGKWLQLLKEVDPRLMRIGIIYIPDGPVRRLVPALYRDGSAKGRSGNHRDASPERNRYRRCIDVSCATARKRDGADSR
jgi:hypothetical protein